ncbi:MAG: glycosyltransferase [Rhodothermales bacterium]|nr:glycosyltransferase [Rhodothermales bacterium]MBO6780184.1 glycosyltransferase [Rhodothermales bacterium]
MKPEVLFFDFAYEEYLGIVEQAVHRGYGAIMNQPPMREALQARGVQSRAFSDFATKDDLLSASRYKEQVAHALAARIGEPGVADGFDSTRGNLLVSGGRDLVHRVLNMAENQAGLVRMMQRLLDNTQLGAVVMRSCLSAGQRTIATVAMKHGIPVIELSHGNPDHPDVSPPPVPWHYAALGARGAEFMRMRGLPDSRLHVTGGPHWDDLYLPAQRPSRAEARASLGLPAGQPLVLVTGSYATGQILTFAGHAQSLIRNNAMIARALGSACKDALLAMRPHPGESRQDPGRPPTSRELSSFQKWLAGFGIELAHLDYSYTTLAREKATLFRAADLVIVPDRVSTITTEAMILGVPVILLDNPGIAFTPFYGEADGVCLARNEQDLELAIRSILRDSDFRTSLETRAAQALPDLNHGDDGAASTRVVDLIEQLAA